MSEWVVFIYQSGYVIPHAPVTKVLRIYYQEPGDCQHKVPGDWADTSTPGGDAGQHGHGEDADEQGGEAGHGGQ